VTKATEDLMNELLPPLRAFISRTVAEAVVREVERVVRDAELKRLEARIVDLERRRDER